MPRTCTGDIKTNVTQICASAGYLYNDLDIAFCIGLQGPIDGSPPGSILATATPSGTCNSAGDVPAEGTVTPDGARTFCCQP